jgi:hypothetical protein
MEPSRVPGVCHDQVERLLATSVGPERRENTVRQSMMGASAAVLMPAGSASHGADGRVGGAGDLKIADDDSTVGPWSSASRRHAA